MGRLITTRQLQQRLGISRRTLYRWLDAKKLPQPKVRTTRALRWDEDEIWSFYRHNEDES